MAKKNRVPIPDDIAAEILFLSDRTCCVCNTRGKQVQVHHIDENPTNNNLDNLSILCFECHNSTMIKGGFGRKLEANQIRKYNNDWTKRVKSRRDKADEIASIQTLTNSQTVVVTDHSKNDFLCYNINDNPNLLIEYLGKILIAQQTQLTFAQEKWDTGVTSTMKQGNYDMVDFYEEVLIELSSFYPIGHFNKQNPKEFFSEIISSMYLWHRLVLEPDGIGTGGTIISTITGGNVMDDLKQMVVDMVNALLWIYEIEERIDLKKWKEEWLKQ